MRLLTLRTIVVATDLDASSDGALISARSLSGSAGAALHVVHVAGAAQGSSGVTPQYGESTVSDVRASLQRAGFDEGDAKVHVVAGTPADAIRSLADRLSADLIVVGRHRERSASRLDRHLGGTARAIVDHAFAPCLVTAVPLRLPLSRVLVPIDRSDTARGALLVGLSWASALRAGTAADEATTLDVLHVETPDASAAPTTSLAREVEIVGMEAGGWAGVAIRSFTESGSDVAQAIAQRARDSEADLVVLGTRGLGLTDVHTLGSVSAAVVATVALPVLLVPPPVWRAHGTLA